MKGFVYEDVIKQCNAYGSVNDQIRYLKAIYHKWMNNRPKHDPNGDMTPNFQERISNEIKFREEIIKEDDKNIISSDIVKIVGKTGLIDISRIFIAMEKSGIISSKTEASQIARIFFSEPIDKEKLARKFISNRNDQDKNQRNSNSNELAEFIKILIENNFNKKEKVLSDLETHINKLQKNLI